MSDVLERLSELASLQDGEAMPAWLVGEDGSWGVGMRQLMTDAADEISKLRANCDRLRALGIQAAELAKRSNDNALRSFREIKEALGVPPV